MNSDSIYQSEVANSLLGTSYLTTQSIGYDYALLGSGNNLVTAAWLPKAGYALADYEPRSHYIDSTWTPFNDVNPTADKYLSGLQDSGWALPGSLDGIASPVPMSALSWNNGFSNELYKSGNAAALVATKGDTLVIVLRGTNDGRHTSA